MKRLISALLLVALLLTGATAEASRTCDGNNANYLQAASNAAYNISAFGDVSVAAWIKRADSAATSMPLYQPTGTYGIMIFSDDKVYSASGGAGKSTTTITDTNWHHVAITLTSVTFKVYIDGTDVSNGSNAQQVAGGQDVINVCSLGGNNTFNGQVAYVAVWNTVLSGANITTLQTSTTPESVGTGNIASWHLCNTGDLTDSSATANSLAAVGAGAVWSSDNPSIGCGGGGGTPETFGFRYRRAM